MAVRTRREEGRVTDPIEQSKIGAVERRKPDEEPKAVAEPLPVPETPAQEPKVVEPVVNKTAKYRVTNNVTISWGAGMIRLKRGALVGEDTHGPGCIEQMRNAGVALERVQE